MHDSVVQIDAATAAAAQRALKHVRIMVLEFLEKQVRCAGRRVIAA